MKKYVKLKKITSLSLVIIMTLSVVSCSNGIGEASMEDEAIINDIQENDVVKPDKITVFADSPFGAEVDSASWAPWEEKYQELTGIEISLVKPPHNEYDQQLALAFTTGEVPDVIELSSTVYPTYATNGALWDMTDSWETSDLKKAGTVDEKYVDALRIDDVLYGFPLTRGGGTVTYVRKDWLDNLGMDIPTNYEEFNEMLRAFTYDDPDGNGVDDTYGITMPGLTPGNNVTIQYQREYFQDATPGIYQKADGTYVDGMLEPQMIDALQRMKDDYSKGYLDFEVVTNNTSTCREKFYESNVGVFNYWAGAWNATLQDNLVTRAPDGVVVPISVIEETYYNERPPLALAITNKAENPEGIFKYLLEYSHDGGEGEMLFTHGVEGYHYTVKDGKYTKLPDVENPKVDFEKAWYAPELSFTTFEDPFPVNELVENSLEVFSEGSKMADLPVMNEEYARYQPDIIPLRDLAVSEAVTSDMPVEDAIAEYEEASKFMVDEVLDSLNNN